ncbi:MAG: hypothetical protein L6R39_006367 [Caloplaca ligustica]|nr:MAG: hypothetical protein L6R39_006367 [Caloplaca ligustica]
MARTSLDVDELEQRFRNLVVSKMPAAPHSRFFDLPREIRDQIYRELLCSRKVYRPASDSGIGRRYNYQIALLRCNKQIHEEATPVLYQENCFIYGSLDWSITDLTLRSLVRPFSHARRGHRKALSLPLAEIAAFVQIRTSSDSLFGYGDHFVITPWELRLAMQRLRREKPVSGPKTIWECGLGFSRSFKSKTHRAALIDGFLGLQHLVRLPRFQVYGLTGPEANLLSVLWTGEAFLHIDECIAHASAFEDRGDNLLTSGDSNNEFLAYKNFYEGELYLASFGKNREFTMLRGYTPKKLCTLTHKLAWMKLACAVYQMNHGPLVDGIESGTWWLRSYPLSSAKYSAKFGYYIGSVLMRHSKELQAIFYFSMALRARPGWDAVERKVDELKQRMQADFTLRSRIEMPFDLVLSPVCKKPCRILTDWEWAVESRDRVIHHAKIITRLKQLDWARLWDYGDPANGRVPNISYVDLEGLKVMAKMTGKADWRDLRRRYHSAAHRFLFACPRYYLENMGTQNDGAIRETLVL